MTILHLSAAGVDGGGAARATYRLHKGLRERGVDSRVLVEHNTTSDPTVYGTTGFLSRLFRSVRRRLNLFPVRYYRDRDPELFSPAWVPERREKQVAQHDPDIVNLHWVAGGFLQPKTIAQFAVPVVWTLHDMWPFTGGCHYSRGCNKYESQCGACPHLGSDNAADLANRVWQRKADAWRDVELTVVAPSRWLADVADQSALLSDATIEVVPNALNTRTYHPRPPNSIRSDLNIPVDKHLVCFGAAYPTPRKGLDLLYDALDSLETPAESVHIATFGDGVSGDAQTNSSVHHLGFVEEDTLRCLYSDADVMVVPSRQEAFGQTASEALASGTPVVCFDSTGLRDIVDHEETGYAADCYDPADLARGIDWILADSDRLAKLGERAREVAEARFSLEVVSKEYQDLYRRVCK